MMKSLYSLGREVMQRLNRQRYPIGITASGSLAFNRKKENNMKATILNNTDGTAGLFGPGGDLIKTYSRARDARRGATRLGYVVNG